MFFVVVVGVHLLQVRIENENTLLLDVPGISMFQDVFLHFLNCFGFNAKMQVVVVGRRGNNSLPTNVFLTSRGVSEHSIGICVAF